MWHTRVRLCVATAASTAVLSSAISPPTRAASPISSQRRIREIMVRQLLLSPQPLTPRELVDAVGRVYNKAEKADRGKRTNVSSSFKDDDSSNTAMASGCGEEIEEGSTKTRASTAQGYVEYLRDLLMSASAEAKDEMFGSQKRSSYLVESTVRLLLALDSQFRISPAGYVCYPNLPSLILSSTNVDQSDPWLCTGRRLVRAEEGKHSCGSGEDTVTASVGSSNVTPGWSYMLSLWFMLDALMETEDGIDAKDAASNATVNSSDCSCVNISQRLVKHWVSAFDRREIPLLLHQASSAGTTHSGSSTVFSASSFRMPLELRESVEGNDSLRRWCSEANEGYLSAALTNVSQLAQSAPLLFPQINEQVGYLFTYIIGTPITLGRLAALIQWPSLSFAGHYHSLLHFLLVYTGNPAVVQMERQEMRRREAQKRWRDLLWSRLREERGLHGPQRRLDERHLLSGRYASREYAETTPNVDERVAAGARKISAEQYTWWMQCSCGPSVNPKLVDVCRCMFLEPGVKEPLDIATHTPSELLESVEAAEMDTNGVVVFCTMPYVFERRICRLIRAWWTFEGQYTTKNKPSDAIAAITVRRLCQLCLWEHEYGAAAASDMMLHYLRSATRGETSVQLVPPSAASTSTEDAGRWLVVLRLEK